MDAFFPASSFPSLGTKTVPTKSELEHVVRNGVLWFPAWRKHMPTLDPNSGITPNIIINCDLCHSKINVSISTEETDLCPGCVENTALKMRIQKTKPELSSPYMATRMLSSRFNF